MGDNIFTRGLVGHCQSVRLDQHRKGTGARLTQVVFEHGGSWVVARIMPSLLTEFAIRDFEAYSQKIHPGATLYVPPVGTRPIVDHELLQDIASA